MLSTISNYKRKKIICPMTLQPKTLWGKHGNALKKKKPVIKLN